MTLFLLSLGVSLLVAGWVVHPVVARRLARIGDVAPSAVLDAEARKRVALASLKEVEYDHLAGKLDDADYAEMRALLSVEAMQAIRAAEAVAIPVVLPPTAHGCGFLNPGGSRFCAGCGARLS